VLSFGGLLFCFFFGEAKKKRSPLQATGRIVYTSFNEKINGCTKDIFKNINSIACRGLCHFFLIKSNQKSRADMNYEL
jgi:hypothetical protein